MGNFGWIVWRLPGIESIRLGTSKNRPYVYRSGHASELDAQGKEWKGAGGKWVVEEVREAGLVMREAEGGGYEEKTRWWSGPKVLDMELFGLGYEFDGGGILWLDWAFQSHYCAEWTQLLINQSWSMGQTSSTSTWTAVDGTTFCWCYFILLVFIFLRIQDPTSFSRSQCTQTSGLMQVWLLRNSASE